MVLDLEILDKFLSLQKAISEKRYKEVIEKTEEEKKRQIATKETVDYLYTQISYILLSHTELTDEFCVVMKNMKKMDEIDKNVVEQLQLRVAENTIYKNIKLETRMAGEMLLFLSTKPIHVEV